MHGVPAAAVDVDQPVLAGRRRRSSRRPCGGSRPAAPRRPPACPGRSPGTPVLCLVSMPRPFAAGQPRQGRIREV